MAWKLTVSKFYAEARRTGKLLGLRCDGGHVTVPPRRTCRVCMSPKLQVVEMSGTGKLVSFTEVHAKSKEFPLSVPYVLALVRMEEGGNLLGVVIQPSSNRVEPGSRVKVGFRDLPRPDNDHRSPETQDEGPWPRIFFELS